VRGTPPTNVAVPKKSKAVSVAREVMVEEPIGMLAVKIVGAVFPPAKVVMTDGWAEERSRGWKNGRRRKAPPQSLKSMLDIVKGCLRFLCNELVERSLNTT
jgi:hypothetical protein